MSSSKTWILRSVKHRLGWTLVIAAAALITTLALGNSLGAAVVAIGIVIALSALIPSDQKDEIEADYPTTRSRGAPYLTSHAWKLDRRADLAEITRALDSDGYALRRERESSNEVVLRGGSQLRTRLLGGYFVNP